MKLIDRKVYPHGITEEWWLRPDGKITVRRMQDAEPIFSANTQQRNAPRVSSALNETEGLGTQVARIPNGLIEQVMKESGVNLYNCSDAQFKRFLNDSGYAKIRTKEGKV